MKKFCVKCFIESFHLAIFSMPKANSCPMKERVTLPISVVCDNIRDPGNLGTIIRSCAAAGCDRLIATKGCVDVWDPKVIRSSMGGHFRVPIVNDVQWERIRDFLPEKSEIFLADHRHSLENENFLEKDDRNYSTGLKFLTKCLVSI